MTGNQSGVLALHVGTRTGWAFGEAGSVPRSGTWRLSLGKDPGEIGAAMFDALGDHCSVMKPARIVLSSAIIDPGDDDSADLAVVAIGLTFSAQVFGVRKGIAVALFNGYDIREHYLPGKRDRMDDRVVSWCRRQGHDPRMPPAAHAVMLWTYALGREREGRAA